MNICPSIQFAQTLRPQLSIAALFLMVSLSAFSQKTTTWKGGAPGMETAWDCPKNWSEGAVPNEFSNVFIPDVSTTTRAAPVIKKGSIEVNALYLDSHARLTIEKAAELIVYETAGGVNTATIRLRGKIQLPEGAAEKTRSSLANGNQNRQ